MSKEKSCAERILENYESRNETIKEMLVHSNGQFSEYVEEQVERFVEEFTKTYNEEPSEEEVDKFRQQCYESSEYNELSLGEFPLGITSSKIVRIELSTGGPADFIKVYMDDNNFIESISYHYQDWFDGAEMQVKESDPMWEFAESILAWNIDGYN
jgi:hypothetical protein